MKTYRTTAFVFVLVGTVAVAGPPSPTAADYEFHTFQAPDALDTLPFGLNNQGLASGLWYGWDFTPEGSLTAEYGFLYSIEGGLWTVEAPFPGVRYTLLYQINQRGDVAAGVGTEPSVAAVAAVYHSRSDTWTVLPDPDPSSVSSQAVGINDRGQIFGSWGDNLFWLNNHGWIYERGQYTFFDAPGASPDSYGTLVSSANNRGDVAGDYYDSDGGVHGYVRYGQDGRIETIDVPFGVPGTTSAMAISNQGTIVGSYLGDDGRRHGFILRNGEYTVFDAPGAANTALSAINDRGDLAGYTYVDWDHASVAFIAIRKGK